MLVYRQRTKKYNNLVYDTSWIAGLFDIFNYFAYDWTVKSERKVTWLDPKNGMLLDVSVSSKNKDKKRNKKRYNKHLILI
jgi:hypothetical protein